ncbi:MAG: 1-acyl-sn-glycerol-3-phosphate acyltransferase [Oscillospiraceae bacterium]|jgi:1-acyl-sn-glycerol-3-phosphate acyltransferase|nr:1-acyl-sn-glycerol-3-phosphate acyltransferase [Oscillospiraceae bacterium]
MAQSKVYQRLFPFANRILRILYRPQITGLENVPREGAFIVYANHSSNIDAFLMMCFIGREHQLHVLAKKEIFKVPVLGAVAKATEMICVDRSKMDINSVRLSLNYLKAGEKLGIFPEGTRVSEGESVDAKSGIIRLADKTRVPVLPMYIPAKKPWFRKTPIVFGESFFINPEQRKLQPEELQPLAEEIMGKIRELRP